VKKEEVLAKIHEVGIVPGIRTSSAEDGRFAAESIAQGGIPIVEITMTVPKAIDVIADMVRNSPNVIVGAGTVLNRAALFRCRSRVSHKSRTQFEDRRVRRQRKHPSYRGRDDANRSDCRVAGGIRVGQGLSLCTDRGPRLHKGTKRSLSAGAHDRQRRCQPRDSRRLHSGGGSCAWNRWTANTESCG